MQQLEIESLDETNNCEEGGMLQRRVCSLQELRKLRRKEALSFNCIIGSITLQKACWKRKIQALNEMISQYPNLWNQYDQWSNQDAVDLRYMYFDPWTWTYKWNNPTTPYMYFDQWTGTWNYSGFE